MSKRRKPVRPWWRKPLVLLLRYRLRRRHLHGSFAHKMLGSRIFEPHLWIPDRESTARGMAIGMFFGMLPLVGLQMVLSALVCIFWRGNVAAATLATLVSNPFTAPGLVWAQIKLGQWLTPAMENVDMSEYARAAKYFLVYGKPLLFGSLFTAVVGGLLAYPLAHWAWLVGEKALLRRRARRAAAAARARAAAHDAVAHSEP